MRISVPLTSDTDTVNSIGGNTYNQQADSIATDNAAIYCEDKDLYYPDLEIDYDGETAPSCIINGNPVQSVELIGGVHQPQRPK